MLAYAASLPLYAGLRYIIAGSMPACTTANLQPTQHRVIGDFASPATLHHRHVVSSLASSRPSHAAVFQFSSLLTY
jgi:hypothetical protein